MRLEVLIEPNKLKKNQLVDIYKLFCQAYEFEPSEIDEPQLRAYGVDRIRDSWGLDFRPWMGAKFFARKGYNGGVAFRGYAHRQPMDETVPDPRGDIKYTKFKELLAQYCKDNELGLRETD